MNYATGYALTIKDLFKKFNTKKLKLKASICEKLIGNRHKELVALKVFKYAIKLVIDDIINNNVTFELPTGKLKASLKMKRFTEEYFKKARQKGKWKDVDFLASNFSGNLIVFTFMSQGIQREKFVYIDKNNKDLITKYTNEGKLYY